MSVLDQLAQGLAGGSVSVVDLTETLRPEYPTIQLPEEFKQALPFSKQQISRYDDDGPAWYWNNFSMSEHTGTHFDAPIHWVSGKDLYPTILLTPCRWLIWLHRCVCLTARLRLPLIKGFF